MTDKQRKGYLDTFSKAAFVLLSVFWAEIAAGQTGPGVKIESEKLSRFLSEKLAYPKAAKQAGVQGEVQLEFYITPEGDFTDIRVLSGIGHGCDEEAVRVLNQVPEGLVDPPKSPYPIRTRSLITIRYHLQQAKVATNYWF